MSYTISALFRIMLASISMFRVLTMVNIHLIVVEYIEAKF